jgi:hypothetical protein
MTEQQHGYGFKCLDPTGATYPDRRDGSEEMLYTLPRPGEKWGPWMDHPNPSTADGQACGWGRYHVHLRLSAVYAPHNWWPWFAEWRQPVGADREKVGVLSIRLRRIAPKVLARALRPPFNWGHNADLRNADLSNADLGYAKLGCANLSYANLSYAHFLVEQLEGAIR